MMQATRRIAPLLIASLLLAAGPQRAVLGQSNDLVIQNAWARATPKGASVGGGYLVIDNRGATADRLLGCSVTVSARCEIHSMELVNGVAQMRPAAAGLTIAPGGNVTLTPGGFHLMFVALKQPIAPNDTLQGSLTFEKAGTIPVTFAVVPVGAGPPRPMHHH